MLKGILQIGMFIIPAIVALYILLKNKQSSTWMRIKWYTVYFFLINVSVYLVSYVRGIKELVLHNMTYSYCVKWLMTGIAFSFCYTVGIQCVRTCFHRADKRTKCTIILLMQAIVLVSVVLLSCCKEYQSMDLTDKMRPSQFTYLNNDHIWKMARDGYQKNDIILNGPYMTLERGTYTITVDYDSSASQYVQVRSEQHPANLETETSIFLGGRLSENSKVSFESGGHFQNMQHYGKQCGVRR